MDPFVTLTAAAMATKSLKVGTGVCLVNQRDPIQTAKLVASIDQVSGGRFLFGIGVGWNAEEMEDHGTEFTTRAKLVRERVEAMKAIWTKSKAEYHGEFVNFPEMMAWPKCVQKPHAPVIVGGAFPQAARRAVRYGDGWIPLAGRGDILTSMTKFREMLKAAGREEASCPITLFGCADDADTLKRYRDLGRRARLRQPAGGAGRRGPADPRQMGGTDSPGQRLNHCDDRKGKTMHFGASMFFTDYSMTAAEFAQALEARGFESVWAAEHSHIPTSRRSPWGGGGELPKQYYDVMDPFVTLTAAAVATKTLKVGTGVCLVNQRDTIQTAKLVASIDQVSGGRFLFGIGIGWNAEEMEDHGTVFATRAKLVRERVEAMKAIWTKSKAEYHGELVNFPEMMAWPKPVQKPHPPVIVGGAYPAAARRAVRYGDGWIPLAGRPDQYGDVFDFVPKFRAMLKEAGRDEASCPVTLFNVREDADLLKRYRDLGAVRVSVSLPAEKADKTLPVLDRWARLISQINS